MTTLTLYFLAAFGLAYIVGHSVISMPLRAFIAGPPDKPRRFFATLIELVECPACFGTWIGIITGGLVPTLFLQFVNGNSTVTYFDGRWYVGALVGGCATAAVNFLLGSWAGLIDGPEDPAESHMKRMLMHMVQSQLLNLQKPPPDPDAALHEQPPEDTFTEHDERQLDLLSEHDEAMGGVPHPLDQNGPLGITDDKVGL